MFGDNFEWDNTHAISDEGTNINEKKSYARFMQIISIIGILLSGPSLYFTIIYSTQFGTLFFYIILGCSCSGAFISLLAFIWAITHFHTTKITE